jgi:hypothetical protein
LNFVQEKAWNTLEAMGIGKVFLSRTQAAQQLRERIDKWHYMKLKSCFTTKQMVSKLKKLTQNGRKYLLPIYRRRDQNIQRAQKIKLPQNQ